MVDFDHFLHLLVIRGENARRGYGHNRSATIWAIIIIQKQTRNYFKNRLLQDHQSAVLTQLQSGKYAEKKYKGYL